MYSPVWCSMSSRSCSLPIFERASSGSISGYAGFGEAGEDLLEAEVFDRVRAEEVRVFGDHRGADLFRVPVRGQVGARVEDLAAAGRDGDEAIERDRVADGPGRDHDDDAEDDDGGDEEGALPVLRRVVPGGRSGRRGGSRSPGTRGGPGRGRRGSVPAPPSARASPPSPAQKIAEHRAGEERRRQRLGHQHPRVLDRRRIDRDHERRDQRRDDRARRGAMSLVALWATKDTDRWARRRASR